MEHFSGSGRNWDMNQNNGFWFNKVQLCCFIKFIEFESSVFSHSLSKMCNGIPWSGFQNHSFRSPPKKKQNTQRVESYPWTQDIDCSSFPLGLQREFTNLWDHFHFSGFFLNVWIQLATGVLFNLLISHSKWCQPQHSRSFDNIFRDNMLPYNGSRVITDKGTREEIDRAKSDLYTVSEIVTALEQLDATLG